MKALPSERMDESLLWVIDLVESNRPTREGMGIWSEQIHVSSKRGGRRCTAKHTRTQANIIEILDIDNNNLLTMSLDLSHRRTFKVVQIALPLETFVPCLEEVLLHPCFSEDFRLVDRKRGPVVIPPNDISGTFLLSFSQQSMELDWKRKLGTSCLSSACAYSRACWSLP